MTMTCFLPMLRPRVFALCQPCDAQWSDGCWADGSREYTLPVGAGLAFRHELSTDVLAFDTTNFDTYIATTTPGELARRGHAKSKRSDLRVVGLGLLASPPVPS